MAGKWGIQPTKEVDNPEANLENSEFTHAIFIFR
jgi:hypothetical protein